MKCTWWMKLVVTFLPTPDEGCQPTGVLCTIQHCIVNGFTVVPDVASWSLLQQRKRLKTTWRRLGRKSENNSLFHWAIMEQAMYATLSLITNKTAIMLSSVPEGGNSINHRIGTGFFCQTYISALKCFFCLFKKWPFHVTEFADICLGNSVPKRPYIVVHPYLVVSIYCNIHTGRK